MNELVEIWKPIIGYEGIYECSNFGKVKSLSNCKQRKEKVLKPFVTKGYLQIELNKNGKRKKYYLHRLVAIHFLENPYNLPEVNHKDECKTNNMVWVNEDGSIDYNKSNLEWCSREYNNRYGNRLKKASIRMKDMWAYYKNKTLLYGNP